MCGIAGIIGLAQQSPLSNLSGRLEAMAAAMQHRGPDDQGIYISPDDRVGFTTRRLAIRDLSPCGHMPMGNAPGTVWITFNGEIYNADELRQELEALGYTFHSTADTEAILHGYEAWGDAVVQRLHGMFAFAIYDRRPTPSAAARVFLARDRLGIKPLYYARTGEAFVFASELKAAQAAGLLSREADGTAVVGYLMLGSVPPPRTIYRDIAVLPPAHSLEIEFDAQGRARVAEPQRYWAMPDETHEPVSRAEALEQTHALLEQAVRSHLVSDVPLGAFLSGGIDSSAVVMLMRRFTSGPIHTCAMTFEEAEFNEGPYARAVAEAVGSDHYERVVTAADVEAAMPRLLWALDQPSLDGVNTYFVSETAREAGLTVAMSGLGGDELFGGYPNTFEGVPQMLRNLRRIQSLPGGVALAALFSQLLPNRQYWAKARDALRRPASPASAYLARRGLFAPEEVKALVPPEVWAAATAEFDPIAHIRRDVRAYGEFRGAPGQTALFSWISRAELGVYTQQQLLRDTDAMSMAHSLEVRVPLLDDRLVEAMLRLPGALKRFDGRMKPLLVDAVNNDFEHVLEASRAKQGFTFPFGVWMHDALRPQVETALNANSGGLLRPAMRQKIWQGYLDGHVHWSRPWALAVLSAWGEQK